MLSAIVVAAGRSSRFKSKVSKVLANIGSKPVIYYSLLALSKHRSVDEIIVVAGRGNIKEIARVIRIYKINKVKKIVLGGKERKDSVLHGLRSLGRDTNRVLIHDGARPFINSAIITSVIEAAGYSGAAVSGLPVKPTVKKVNSKLWVIETVDREGLWEIQTPQVFSRDIILNAYRKIGGFKATDDAMLVEKCGVRVKVALGSYSNIKVTTPEDLVIAEAILKKEKTR